MKLTQLIAREPFPTIFCETLDGYLRATKNWDGEVVWGTHGDCGKENFLVNPELNLIFPIEFNPHILKILASEYAYHKNIFKRLLHTVYIASSVSRCLRTALSSHKLQIKNIPQEFSNICILPGNNSIRVLDFCANESVVIVKKGFDFEKIKGAVSVRQAYPNLPGPRIRSFSFNEGWYVEDRIVGLPVNRVGQCAQKRDAIDAAKSFLAEMYSNTRSVENAMSWKRAKLLEAEVVFTTLQSKVNAATSKKIIDLKMLVSDIFDRHFESSDSLVTALTHGDFQDANLLIPRSNPPAQVYIIDWECAAKRCSHYDWFVYGLRSRAPRGLKRRIQNMLDDHASNDLQVDWYDFAGASRRQVTQLAILFLLDDFLFRLDDANRPLNDSSRTDLDVFLDEVKQATDMFGTSAGN